MIPYVVVPPWRLGPIALQPFGILPHADVVLAVFPIFWVFGRAGCAVVHDHPGKRAPADSPLAVAYGPGPSTDLGFIELRHGVEPRYDLGLLELVFAVVLAIAFMATWRSAHKTGFYVVTTFLAYAPVRFMLDFLRAPPVEGGDIRYGLLTPAQWACVAMFGVGVWLLRHVAARERGATPAQTRR
jgi:phosphatidylglycerol:prolipoprotein diacylglycerol transferase